MLNQYGDIMTMSFNLGVSVVQISISGKQIRPLFDFYYRTVALIF